jgi:hypothetical protein
MTIDMNGCDYVFHLGETSGADKYPVSATVVCPIGQHVTFTIFGSATKHTANEPFCHITVTEKTTDYTGLSASDTTNGQVDISGTIEGIKIDKKRANGSILCPAVDEVDENAKLDMEITLEGKNGTGGATPISITHEP